MSSSSSFHLSTLLNYEFTILKLNNLEIDLSLPGNLFIRYYFKPGSEKTFCVDTKCIPLSSSNSMISLNHKALFECRVNSVGDDNSFIEDIKKKKKKMSVMLELRWRRRGYSVFGMKMPAESKLLATVNVPWKDDLVERWVKLERRSREMRGKEIEVLVGMKVWEKEGEIECDCEGCKFGWMGGDDVCF
ncbi:hypothetical protein KFK09_013164 [Dendrobium nobile]|uniref:Uncharacterized protein n=1 Tax=Dendrobium nobile TaxID=94219 RepID=A0A8T3B9B0_DENNO|nr:hypothetical protein KFK09_013164 [Dendrobium nobile]